MSSIWNRARTAMSPRPRARFAARAMRRRLPPIDWLVRASAQALWRRTLRKAGGPLTVAEKSRLLWLEPHRIKSVLSWRDNPAFPLGLPLRDHLGAVLDGDWDRAYERDAIPLFPSAVDRYRNGVDWEDTDFYSYLLAAVRQGRTEFRCRAPSDIPLRLAELDRLYDAIHSRGYCQQAELPLGQPWHEIVVAIDRRGRTLFVDGRHRLAVALALQLDRVPAVVLVRHAQWYDFTANLRDRIAKDGGVSLAPVPHPDLANVPFRLGPEVFESLRAALPLPATKVLDLDPASGYFCHRFEVAGFDCTAVAASEDEGRAIETLRDASDRRFVVRAGPTPVFDASASFDLTLALGLDRGSPMSGSGTRELVRSIAELPTTHIAIPADPPAGAVGHLGEHGGFRDVRLVPSGSAGAVLLLSRSGRA